MLIMSPAGGGKTTLLNALAGRVGLDSGEITFDGVTLNKSMKRKLSYVLQEDIFFPNLTLRETLSVSLLFFFSFLNFKTFFFCVPFNSSTTWAATFNLQGYKCMLVIFIFP